MLQENIWTDPGNIETARRHVNVEIETKAAQLLSCEYKWELRCSVLAGRGWMARW
jgi:hypothetical protein